MMLGAKYIMLNAPIILGHCYENIRAETEKMKEAMGEDFHHNAPRQEVTYFYKDDDNTDSFGNAKVVKMEDNRPKWWPKSMLTKEYNQS